MKVFVVLACVAAIAFAQKTLNKPEGPFVRNLPADTLRDFPGLCFASTKCKVFNVTESWTLDPFCGQATCTEQTINGQLVLVEKVEDCGPLPKPNPACKITNPIDPKAGPIPAFPSCCPQFECAGDAVLEYPTPQELQAAATAAGGFRQRQ